ncbi:MAG: alpha/beta hydrolase [Pseudolabrys sp.]|nr:alpha/beta hydrolase [Pseudolabrys sp.]
MAVIDYEKEYDNRGRVKEHPEIFARWASDSKAFRESAKGAALNVAYGSSSRQIYDYFPAVRPNNGPLVLFIHGGYWRSLEPAMFSHCARGLNEHGFDVALPGYDLYPHVSVTTIIAQMRNATLALWRQYKRPIMLTGHSAGGHLAACLLATDWQKIDKDAPEDLTRAAYAISGVFDLTPLLNVSQNADLRLTPDEARKVSPFYWQAPRGKALDAVVGAQESSEFLRQSRIIAEGWRARGAVTRYEEIAGANHFSVVDPLSDPDSAMVKRIAELARKP